jgi:hypothetical protein
MNVYAKALKTKTFPLADGMYLGKRSMEEYQYLINHGVFTHWNLKHLIIKQHGRYQLLRNNAPAPELEAEASTLDGLIKLFDIPIYMYQWHVNWLEDDDAQDTEQASHLDKLEGEALETLERQQEAEPA